MAEGGRLRKKIGETLVAHGVINEEQLQKARLEQRRSGGRLGDILVRHQSAGEMQIAKALAEQNNIPLMDFGREECDPDAVKLVPRHFAEKYRCIAHRIINNELWVVMADPLSLSVIHDLEFATGMRIQLWLSTPSQILSAIEDYYSEGGPARKEESGPQNQPIPPAADPLPEQNQIEVAAEPHDRNAEASGRIAEIVDEILEQAVTSGASDIHLEAGEDGVTVRQRLDGLLRDVSTFPKWAQNGLISRVKIMASMDISEKRLPQDGRLRIWSKEGRKVDFRVSSLRTLHGEKVVLRILDHSRGIPSLDELGFSAGDLKQVRGFVKRQYGMILTVGPTGSGKSTTLAAALATVRAPEINIVTIEDPVEYEIAGINQTQVHEKIKLTFARSLRAILRQDPDVILVGEIRDQETARIAMQAAQTGHLVLSTLHTDDAPSAVTRLCDMGIEPYIIGSTLVGVIAQRLVRKLCEHCRKPYVPPDDVLTALNITRYNLSWPMYHSAGCPECRHTGYRGRVGIYQLMSISDRISRLISQHGDENAIRDAALEAGMLTLGDDGLAKVKAGITSPDELLRVVTEEKEIRTICPGCGCSIGIDFVACPECGRRIGGGCTHCGRALKPSWHFCPFCSNPVSQQRSIARSNTVEFLEKSGRG
jgi:type IV pilus assembly protein PilB